jgi:hypothetical protein
MFLENRSFMCNVGSQVQYLIVSQVSIYTGL